MRRIWKNDTWQNLGANLWSLHPASRSCSWNSWNSGDFFHTKKRLERMHQLKWLKRRGWGDDGDERPLAKCHTDSEYAKTTGELSQRIVKNTIFIFQLNRQPAVCGGPCPWKGHVPVETVIHPGSPWSMPNFVWNTRLDRLASLSLSLL